ncbi:DNA polymerase [Mesorhizobium sp. M0767]|uniref:DNA polymerase n=1 Tax=Mesorhizobium sp. M0767 TaxID=2956995 RepID=UPI00333605DD
MDPTWNWFWPDGSVVTGRKRYAFDIETNGLLPEVNKVHSLVIKDLDTGEVTSCTDSIGGETTKADSFAKLEFGLRLLMGADLIIGHNILSYDIPVLQLIYPWFKPKGIARDTLIMAKMIWPLDKLKELDFPRWRKGTLPGQFIGAHKLEAWGYRMGRMKGEYSATVKELSKVYKEKGIEHVPEEFRVLVSVDRKGEPCLDPWLAWNQPMQDYCVQDVEVTEELLKLIQGHLDGTGSAAKGIAWSERSVALEHAVWAHCDKQQARGFGFNLPEAIKLAAGIKTRQVELEAALVDAFGSWWQADDDPVKGHAPIRAYSEKLTQFQDITVQRVSEKTGKLLSPYVGPPLCHYSPDAPFVRVTRTTFNPKSRQHLGERLQEVFGWVPVEWGGKNNDQATVDETTIKALPESIIPKALKETILEFLINAKTLGQLADGNKSWIGFCGEDKAIHGRVDPLGTITHRGAHSNPNLGQVPGVSVEEIKDTSGKVIQKIIIPGWKGGFGGECRGLFQPVRAGWQQTGVDASGLQLRILGHYLFPYDDGAFSQRVCTPGLDIHAANSEITGLTRGDTKTVTYQTIFGGGPLPVGMAVGLEGYDIKELSSSPGAKNYVSWMKKVMKGKYVELKPLTLAYVVRGQGVIKAFMDGITGLKDFKKDSQELAKAQGFLVAMDGRKLQVRKPHASIVQLLQGGDAIICKEWQIETKRVLLEDYGLVEDVDYGQMGWVHDELQFEHREGLHDIIKEAAEQAMRNVAVSLDFKGILTTEAKLGYNWKDCH